MTDDAVVPNEDAPATGHGPYSFRGEISHRLIHWPSMPRPLKLITGLAIAQILVAAVLIFLGAIQGIGGRFPSVSLYVLDGQLVSTTVPVLIATVVFVSVAWGYLLAGVTHSHALVRVGGLTVFTVVTFSGWDSLNVQGGTGKITVTIVAAIWAVGGIAWLLHHRARRSDPRSAGSQVATAGAFLATALLFGGLYLNAYLTARTEGIPLLFTSSLSLQLASLGVLLIPMLIIAGADFAELADLVGTRVGVLGTRAAGARMVFGLAGAVALAVSGYELFHFRHSLGVISVDVAVGVVALGGAAGLLWLGRVGLRTHLHHVPQGTVVLVAVVGFVLPYTLIFIPAAHAAAAEAQHPSTSYGAYVSSDAPPFHLDKPSLWETADLTVSGGGPNVEFTGAAQGDPALVYVIAFPASTVTPADAVDAFLLTETGHGAWKGQTAYMDAGHDEGAMHVYDIHSVAILGGPTYRARSWTETKDQSTWLIWAMTTSAEWDFNAPVFDHMASTFGLGPLSPASASTSAVATGASPDPLASIERPEVVTLAALLLLALVALVLTRFQWGRRFARLFATAAIFLTLVAALDIAALPNYVLDVVTNTPGHDLTSFHIEGIQTLVGLLSLAGLAWCALRRRVENLVRPIALVLSLNIGLQVISWLYDLYTQSSAVGDFTIAQAIILILAFLVDIALSGEGTTNRDGRLFPRSARVHLYFGYVLMTVAVILYFTSLRYQATGAPVPSQFESDGWAQSGLIELGVPLLVAMFVLGVLSTRRPSRRPATPLEGSS